MTTGKSNAGRYIEFPMATARRDERIRVTLVDNPTWRDKGGFTGPTLRLEKRNARGRLSRGPEFPADQAMVLVAAISQLVTDGDLEATGSVDR